MASLPKKNNCIFFVYSGLPKGHNKKGNYTAISRSCSVDAAKKAFNIYDCFNTLF
jgi:hypothetical protein